MSDNAFGQMDWFVLAAYFIVLAISGVLLSRRQASTDDYFRAGGRMPMWAASVSFLATSLSAATFIGAPQIAYTGNLAYLSSNVGSILAVSVVAIFFVPAFYRSRVVTVYGLLDKHFGALSTCSASGAFIVGRVFADGARLYIAALPASLIVFGDITLKHQLIAIAALTVVGIVYTLIGGIRSVIWTDCLQAAIFIGAAIAAFILLFQKISIGFPEIIDALQSPGEGKTSKLAIFKLGIEGIGPKHTYTLLTAIFGFSLLNLGAYGADQDMAQRLLTCRSAVKGSWSAVTAILMGIPVSMLFMAIGLLLYIFYARPDLMGAAAPAYEIESSRKVFLSFILNEMPEGMSGLMMAGLFAAALSSLNSSLNAMSSSLINDFYKRLRPGLSERHYLFVSCLCVTLFGVTLGIFAVFSAYWQMKSPGTTLIDFALTVMIFSYSGLVAIFLTCLFTNRGNNASVIAALITGFAAVAVMQTVQVGGVSIKGMVAFPWQMFVATVLAFCVCCLGKRQTGRVRLKAEK